jgi:hypothetical protein
LEPSFGGCSFLRSSKDRLEALGTTDATSQLFGCDVDPHAFEHLYAQLGLTQIQNHFVLADFLTVDPLAFDGRQFDVVIGNPPYVRHHDITAAQRKHIEQIRANAACDVSLQANLWAFFVLHSCRFLQKGGRVAWLLPITFVHAHYANSVKTFLARHFRTVTATALGERLFQAEGADEATVILTAEGWSSRASRPIRIGEITLSRVSDLQTSLSPQLSPHNQTTTSERKVFNRLRAFGVPLGAYCSFLIGTVTGDANFFLFSASKAASHHIPSRDLRPIVSRARQLNGLTVSRRELKQQFNAGARTKILYPRFPIRHPVAAYLRTKTRKQISENLTFGKRPQWFRPQVNKKPDAFFTCMSHSGPRLVLNEAQVACTNSLYEIKFCAKLSHSTRLLIAISMMTTFAQLSAELEGRRYGAGMLKHEPSDATRIRLILPEAHKNQIERLFKAIDQHLRTNDPESATRAADEFLIKKGLITEDDTAALQTELQRLRSLRHLG